MKSATSAQRPYQEVGAMIRDLIIKTPYNPGERLPPEREIAEMLDVTRTVVREALIMLEIKGLVEVRRGAGIYVLDSSGSHNTDSPDANVCNDAGPFELLQARQLLESNIAEFAALQATREDIVKMRQALQLEERELASSAPGSSESGDMQFHLAIAEATHNSMLVELFRLMFFKSAWAGYKGNIILIFPPLFYKRCLIYIKTIIFYNRIKCLFPYCYNFFCHMHPPVYILQIKLCKYLYLPSINTSLPLNAKP